MEHNFCNRCGSKNVKGVNYCSECGENITTETPDTIIKQESTDQGSPIRKDFSKDSSFDSNSTLFNKIKLPKRRILLFVFFALLGSILSRDPFDLFSLGKIPDLGIDLFYRSYIRYTLFGLFYCLSLTTLFRTRLNFKKLLFSFIGWGIIYDSLSGVFIQVMDMSLNLSIFISAIIASLISIIAFKKEDIGKYGVVILGLGWGIAIWFGRWTADEGLLFFDASDLAKSFSRGINVAIFGIVISLFAQYIKQKYIQINIRSQLTNIQQYYFSDDDKQTFFISLLLVITSFFLPFYRHDGYSGFVIDEGYIILSFTALLIFNFMFVIKGKPFISLLLSNTIYLLLLITVFIVIKYGDYSGGLFFDESDYSVDLGFYLFIFSIFLSVYTLNKNRFLISKKDENKIK